MNLAVRGLSANLGEVPADTFFKDQHPDLQADFIMANPPFNLKDWRADDELTTDPRWGGYDTPPTGNANYAWILHMLAKLSEHGTAGFVLANGSMSSNTKGEGAIRQKLVENDLVDCMIALPGQLFFTTQIPVCLWFLSKNKQGPQRGHRNRKPDPFYRRPQNRLDDQQYSEGTRRTTSPPSPALTMFGEGKRKMAITKTRPATANPPPLKTSASTTTCSPPGVMSARPPWRMTAFLLRPR